VYAAIRLVLEMQLQAEDLDDRNVAELRKFDAAVALEILEHYSQADFSTVRNRRAYLAGKAHV
jgi:2-polyprenyl-3-methyl-5-hydroxy-6-metoxy-1,4-benzoquinol methylase